MKRNLPAFVFKRSYKYDEKYISHFQQQWERARLQILYNGVLILCYFDHLMLMF